MAKILFLSHRIPFPPNKGDKIRAFHMLRHLAGRHQIWLATFADERGDAAGAQDLADICEDIFVGERNRAMSALKMGLSLIGARSLSVGAFAHAGVRAWCEEIAQSVDLDCVLVYSSAVAQFAFLPVLADTPIIADFVDVDSEKFRQYADRHSWPMNEIYKIEGNRLLDYEKQVAQRAAASIFVSDRERDVFLKRSNLPHEKIFAMPNGVDCDYFCPPQENSGHTDQSPILLFTGRMDYYPNVDAASWFAHDILPKIRDQFPTAVFQIVGAKPDKKTQALDALAGVDVVGGVPDMRPYYANADIVVAPMRIARGIQNKVLEGMAMARPVVTTPDGIEGIDARHEDHVLIGNDEGEITDLILKQLSSNGDSALGGRARRRVLEIHAWEPQLTLLDQLLTELGKDKKVEVYA